MIIRWQCFLIVLAVFWGGIADAFAVRPKVGMPAPKYLSVPNWQSCVGSLKHSTWESYCLPNARPMGCPEGSWEQLHGKWHQGALMPLCSS